MSCLLAPRRPLDARGAGCLPSPASPGRPVFCLADQLASGRSRSQGADRNPHPAEVAPVCFRESRHRRDAARNMLGNGLLAAHPALGNHGENLGTEGQFRISTNRVGRGRRTGWQKSCVEALREALRFSSSTRAGRSGRFAILARGSERGRAQICIIRIDCMHKDIGRAIKEYHSFN